jgi:hypothetical protein
MGLLHTYSPTYTLLYSAGLGNTRGSQNAMLRRIIFGYQCPGVQIPASTDNAFHSDTTQRMREIDLVRSSYSLATHHHSRIMHVKRDDFRLPHHDHSLLGLPEAFLSSSVYSLPRRVLLHTIEGRYSRRATRNRCTRRHRRLQPPSTKVYYNRPNDARHGDARISVIYPTRAQR